MSVVWQHGRMIREPKVALKHQSSNRCLKGAARCQYNRINSESQLRRQHNQTERNTTTMPKITTTIEWSEEEQRGLDSLDGLRTSLLHANAYEPFAYGGEGGIYNLVEKAFKAALYEFIGTAYPNLTRRLGFDSDSDTANYVYDQCLDNGENVSWNINHMIKEGR
jgi:hypothetical protein